MNTERDGASEHEIIIYFFDKKQRSCHASR
jgi:hypothetical protein